MKDEHVNDATQGVVEDVPQDVAQDLGFGVRAARAYGRLCLRLPWHDNRLRGGIGERPHGF